MKIRLAWPAIPVAAAAVAAAVSGCGASSTLDPVAQAATTTGNVRGAQVAMTMTMDLPTGQRLTLPGTGVFDIHDRSGVLNVDMSSLSALTSGKLGGTIEERVIYPTVYMRAAFLTKSIPGGKQWMKIDIAKASQQLTGANLTQISTQNTPADQLQQLRASGHVTRVGTERIRGVVTTHYRGVVDLTKLPNLVPPSQRSAARSGVERLVQLTGSSSYPIDVWVDSRQIIRREHMSYSMRLPGSGQHIAFAMTMDLFNFGPKPAPTPPPASEVFDATGLAKAH